MIDRSVVFKWLYEQREPTSQTIVEIARAIKAMNPAAPQEFIQLCLCHIVETDCDCN